MKKWVESWLIPFVDKVAKTPGQKRGAYVALVLVGLLMSWLGFAVSQVAMEQTVVLDQTRIDGGKLK